ncbi:MAG: DHHA1 domain-containing protein [Nitrososphaerota archaeon]|nr:DHHA1 domain-containing protein [Nitrososphaerales archaeon]MDW8044546.1 DHHA1 domain-containing protein [Nitrososphaerota archaeon]
MVNRICISHRKDVDGLSSAALIKAAIGCKVILSDYDDLKDRLSSVGEFDELYLCDMGLNLDVADKILQYAKNRPMNSIHYIDHHTLDPSILKKIREAGIDVTHSEDESTSVLTYQKFCKVLPKKAELLAAYGAITDYMDLQPIARKIIQGYDRQFILLEATLLSYALARSDDEFLLKLVDHLSEFRYPHQIPSLIDRAIEQAEYIAELIVKIEMNGKRMKNFAYMEVKESITGNIAHFLIGVFDVPIGVVYRVFKDRGVFEVSLRGSSECRHHLGMIASRIANKLGGFGGGHPRASGAQIPLEKLNDFLQLLDQELSRS